MDDKVSDSDGKNLPKRMKNIESIDEDNMGNEGEECGFIEPKRGSRRPGFLPLAQADQDDSETLVPTEFSACKCSCIGNKKMISNTSPKRCIPLKREPTAGTKPGISQPHLRTWRGLALHSLYSQKGKDNVHTPKQTPRQTAFNVGLTFLYFLLALIAVVVTYSMIANLINAMKHPVRSIKYQQVEEHEAPGIAIYPGGATFPACGHYFQNVVTSKVKLTLLDLVNQNCSYVNLTYTDPHYPDIKRNALIIRGPANIKERESVFLHFQLIDPSRDFFTVSYFLFPGWDRFNASSEEAQVEEILAWHKHVPTFALGAGFRFWTKISVKETYFFDDEKHVEFSTEYSVIRHWDKRPWPVKSQKHLFFIFFEWKNNIVEKSFLIYTTTPWSIGAGLCGVFLTLHKAYVLLRESVKRAKKEKMKKAKASG